MTIFQVAGLLSNARANRGKPLTWRPLIYMLLVFLGIVGFFFYLVLKATGDI